MKSLFDAPWSVQVISEKMDLSLAEAVDLLKSELAIATGGFERLSSKTPGSLRRFSHPRDQRYSVGRSEDAGAIVMSCIVTGSFDHPSAGECFSTTAGRGCLFNPHLLRSAWPDIKEWRFAGPSRSSSTDDPHGGTCKRYCENREKQEKEKASLRYAYSFKVHLWTSWAADDRLRIWTRQL